MLAALAALPLSLFAGEPPDRTVELELAPGGSRRVEHEVAFQGSLHVWTRSEIDLSVRVEDASGKLLAEDDDSGGSKAPYVRVAVEPGRTLVIAVAAAEPGAGGALELHLVAAPETAESRALAQHGRAELAEIARLAAGALDEARARIKTLVDELLSAADARSSEEVARVLQGAAYKTYDLGLAGASLRAWTALTESRARCLPPEHADRVAALANLGLITRETGDLECARALEERVLEIRSRLLPADHPDLQAARLNLGITLMELGDVERARVLEEEALAAYERTLPADHPDILLARTNLASTLRLIGDLPAARALEEATVANYERTLHPDHPELLIALMNLGCTLDDLGDAAGARAIHERVVAAFERTLPEGHADLRKARTNLAVALRNLRDFRAARPVQERILADLERALPDDHADLIVARTNLAVSLYEVGDLSGARTLFERALESAERAFEEGHPTLLSVRMNLAGTMLDLGDPAGARALLERVTAVSESALHADHPVRLRALENLASALGATGDLAGARALLERVVAAELRTFPAGSFDTLRTRGTLGATAFRMGDLPGALEAFESLVEDYARTLPEDHPDLLRARMNLATVRAEAGDLSGARPDYERALDGLRRTLPEDDVHRLRAHTNLAWTLLRLGDREGARALASSLVAGTEKRVICASSTSPREASAVAASVEEFVSSALRLGADAGPGLTREVFELVETVRMAPGEAARTLRAASGDAELAPLLAQAAELRAELNDLVAGAGAADPSRMADELARLGLERDRVERAAVAARGSPVRPFDAKALASRLPAASVAVGFRRYAGPAEEGSVGRLLAHVLGRDGSLTRVELGSAAELEAEVEGWRAALGHAVGRGSGVAAPGDETERERGARLRAKLLDPLLAAAGDVRTLFVCPDDLVFLVPLDALPAGPDGARVGDRVRCVVESSFARRLGAAAPPPGEASLVAFGGIDYGASPEGELLADASAPIEASSRGAGETSFAPLPGAEAEARAVGAVFARAFGHEAFLASGGGATKAALAERASGARFLHLATHGWFAPESVKSVLDADAGDEVWSRMRVEDAVTGFAPMTLCGLALAGANRGRDELGRVGGILTAEELCSLDLARCELAVLSACETNVGLRRAGQGIQSLQAALHAAGARTAITSLWKDAGVHRAGQGIQSLQAALHAAGARASITSLWKVGDAATRRLMELFYTELWEQRRTKAEALWRAKRALASEGHPVRDWAAWVLSGDPD